MDPLVSKSLIKPVKTVRLLLRGAVADNESFRDVYNLYGQATKEAEQMEQEAAEKERRWRIYKTKK